MLEKILENPLDCKEIKPVNPKGNQSWIFIGRTNAEAKAPVLWPPDAKYSHLKRPWCWERLKAAEEGDSRGWDGLMASLTQWTWIWTSSRSWWWTGKPGMLQSMGSQRVRHDWVTELNWLGFKLKQTIKTTKNILICSSLIMWNIWKFQGKLNYWQGHRINFLKEGNPPMEDS